MVYILNYQMVIFFTCIFQHINHKRKLMCVCVFLFDVYIKIIIFLFIP